MPTQEKYLNKFIILNENELTILSLEERMAYEDSLKYYRDIRNVENTAEERGKLLNQTEVIKNSLSEGLSMEIIAKITKLSIEGIQEIINSLKK
ncbi:hypothetical protein V9L05_14940 [Bernardetia sp. Wsw4-3y2]|uniref:hypothetical protein n=1 Tax=Bernardetia sp. Wsw4-3y2 TaxID=3127471 RepID=UPI0030D5C0E5